MAEQIGASFIPKKTIPETQGQQSQARAGMGLFTLIATIIFVISLVLAGGVYFYEQYLEGSIDRKAASLERAQEAFEPALIKELSRLSARIESTQELLEAHPALSAFFDHLEVITLRTVRFDDFSFAMTDAGLELLMSGEADSFSSVALQAEEFGESDFVTEPIFSNLNLNAFGNVTFDFAAKIDPALVAYESNLPDGVIPFEEDEGEEE